MEALAARGERMPLSIALRVLLDVCEGLHHAHEAVDENGQALAVIHRDVTPSNIFLTRSGRAKVLDFGVAKAATGRQTTTGVVKGKYSYMAPEQIKMSKTIDRRVDIFALGVVSYELLTGTHPFRQDGEYNTLSAIVSLEVPPPSTLQNPTPPPFDAVVTRALAKSCDDRFASMSDFSDALQRAASEANLKVATAEELKVWLERQTSDFESKHEERAVLSDNQTKRSDETQSAALAPPDSQQAKITERIPPKRRSAVFVVVALLGLSVGGATFAFWPAAPSKVEDSVVVPPKVEDTKSVEATKVEQTEVLVPPKVEDSKIVEAPKGRKPPEIKKPPEAPGYFKVEMPYGVLAVVYVDGAEIHEEGPPWKTKEFEISPGAHTIELKLRSPKVTIARKIKIIPKKTVLLTVEEKDLPM
jgi:serine/threonine-protein kinase